MKFCDWWLYRRIGSNDYWPCCYSADTSEERVRELAAKALGVEQECVEVLETGGCWLARERREDECT